MNAHLDPAFGESETHITPYKDEIEHEFTRDCWCSPRPPKPWEIAEHKISPTTIVHRPSWEVEEIQELGDFAS